MPDTALSLLVRSSLTQASTAPGVPSCHHTHSRYTRYRLNICVPYTPNSRFEALITSVDGGETRADNQVYEVVKAEPRGGINALIKNYKTRGTSLVVQWQRLCSQCGAQVQTSRSESEMPHASANTDRVK